MLLLVYVQKSIICKFPLPLQGNNIHICGIPQEEGGSGINIINICICFFCKALQQFSKAICVYFGFVSALLCSLIGLKNSRQFLTNEMPN